MPKTKKTNQTTNKYVVEFINTYKLENVGCDDYRHSYLADYIYADNICEAYKNANQMLELINSVDPMQKYTIKKIDIYEGGF